MIDFANIHFMPSRAGRPDAKCPRVLEKIARSITPFCERPKAMITGAEAVPNMSHG